MAYTSKRKRDLSFPASEQKVPTGPSSMCHLLTSELITVAKWMGDHDRWGQGQMAASVMGGMENHNLKPHQNHKA